MLDDMYYETLNSSSMHLCQLSVKADAREHRFMFWFVTYAKLMGSIFFSPEVQVIFFYFIKDCEKNGVFCVFWKHIFETDFGSKRSRSGSMS